MIVAFRSAKVARAQPSRNATFAEQKATIKRTGHAVAPRLN